MTSQTLASMAKFFTTMGCLLGILLGIGFVAHARTLEILELSRGDGSLKREVYGLDYFNR